MIYSKSRNFIFLRVPKTASTSIYHEILDCVPDSDITLRTPIKSITSISNRELNVKALSSLYGDYEKLPNPHPNLAFLLEKKVISYEDLSMVDVYAVIRDPIDRFISCAHHFARNKVEEEFLTNDKAVDFLFEHGNDDDDEFVFNKSQCHWLMHDGMLINKIFRFDQINDLVKELCNVDAVKYTHKSEYRVNKTTNLATSLRLEIMKRFPEDFFLWESLQPPQP